MNLENDPFDEFEFKPLTSGLGFHKKNESSIPSYSAPNPARPVSTNPIKFKTQAHIQALNNAPRINVPILEDDSIVKAQSAVNEILKNLNQKKQTEQNLKNKSTFNWSSTAPSLAAAALDAMFVIAFFLICMISALTITKVDLISQLSNSASDPSIWIATGSLFLMVYFVYMTLFRTYMGYTPGEWAFDQRCGKETDQAKSSYVFKLTLRHLVVGLTGFVPLALISTLLKYDLTGTLINLPVQKRVS